MNGKQHGQLMKCRSTFTIFVSVTNSHEIPQSRPWELKPEKLRVLIIEWCVRWRKGSNYAIADDIKAPAEAERTPLHSAEVQHTGGVRFFRSTSSERTKTWGKNRHRYAVLSIWYTPFKQFVYFSLSEPSSVERKSVAEFLTLVSSSSLPRPSFPRSLG